MASNNQDMETPVEFVQAVEKYFKISFKHDMAASPENTKCKNYFTVSENSLKIDWPLNGWCWLNPPFQNLTAWIKKCKEQKDRGCRIISIWPLSGDKNQIISWTRAEIYVLHGRIWPHVRGIMLCKWKLNQSQLISGLIWDRKKLTRKWYLKSNKNKIFRIKEKMAQKVARACGCVAAWLLSWAWAWTWYKPPTHFKAF